MRVDGPVGWSGSAFRGLSVGLALMLVRYGKTALDRLEAIARTFPQYRPEQVQAQKGG